MPTGPSTPQASNVFLPNWEASGKYAVGFARNPESFRLASYVHYVKSPKIKGYYLKFTNQESGRVLDNNRYVWPYGKPAPVPQDPESFTYVPFTLERRAYAYGLDRKTIDQADHNVKQVERDTKATKAMTARVMRAISVITTAANWQTSADADLAANHTATATALVGGKLDTGTASNPLIMNALNAMAIQVTLDTMGSIVSKPENFKVVFNPNFAKLLVATPEYKAYLTGSPDAYNQVKGNLHPNNKFGLPDTLYGYGLVIEDAVKVTNNKGGTLARSFAWPDATAALMHVPGKIDGVYGEPSFSTFTCFHDKDMLVEEFTDERNDMWEGRVVEETDEILTCPASGYLLTSAVG